jgi:hypothetical protein
MVEGVMCRGWSSLYIIAIHLINRSTFSFPQMLLCALGIRVSVISVWFRETAYFAIMFSLRLSD